MQPAIRVTARRQIGMILFQRSVRTRSTLCREHGIQFVSDYLARTLVQGWWGVFAFFVNLFVIATDFAALARLRKLPSSETEDADALPRAG